MLIDTQANTREVILEYMNERIRQFTVNYHMIKKTR